MFSDLPPTGPPRLEDLSTEDLERMLGREPGSTIAAAISGLTTTDTDKPKPC